MTKTIEFNNKTYELINEENEYLTFKLLNKYENYSLDKLGNTLYETQYQIKEKSKEAQEYQERIDEFYYCGYTEEDPDFHGMCLHQNQLDKEVHKLEQKKLDLFEELEKRCNKDEDIDFETFCCDFEIEY